MSLNLQGLLWLENFLAFLDNDLQACRGEDSIYQTVKLLETLQLCLGHSASYSLNNCLTFIIIISKSFDTSFRFYTTFPFLTYNFYYKNSNKCLCLGNSGSVVTQSP